VRVQQFQFVSLALAAPQQQAPQVILTRISSMTSFVL
jgi:hypothetical protein